LTDKGSIFSTQSGREATFKAVRERHKALVASGERGVAGAMTTHAGMTTEEFERLLKIVATAKHSR
jgi:hypothetical protein